MSELLLFHCFTNIYIKTVMIVRNQEKISQTQLMMTTFMYSFGSHGFIETPIISIGNYSSWIIMIIANLLAMLLVLAAVTVTLKFPHRSFLDGGGMVVGKWLHVCTLLYMLFFFFHLGAQILRQFIDYMTQTYFPKTPDEALLFLFTFVVIVAVRYGVESIVRFAQMLFFLVMIAGFTIPIFLLKDIDSDMAIAFVNRFELPVIWEGVIYIIPWYADTVIFIFVMHLLSDQPKTTKSIVIGTALMTLMYVPTLMMTIFMFGPHFAADLTGSGSELIRQINYVNFIENIDLVYISVWMTGIFVKISICLFVSCIIVAKLLRVADYRRHVNALGLCLIGLSIHMSENFAEMNEFFMRSWAGFAWTVILLPVLYWLIAKIRRSVEQKTEKRESL